MFKMKVHGQKENPAKEMALKLVQDANGVVLVAVDRDGKEIKGGSIMRIDNTGLLIRIPAISKNLGMKVNKHGQILEKFSHVKK